MRKLALLWKALYSLLMMSARLRNRLFPKKGARRCMSECTTLTLRVTILRMRGCRIPMVMLLLAVRCV